MKGSGERVLPIAVSQIVAPLSIQKRIANVRAKAALFRDLIKVERIIQHSAPDLNPIQGADNVFHYVLLNRSEFFEEEEVLDACEMAQLLREAMLIAVERSVEARKKQGNQETE